MLNEYKQLYAEAADSIPNWKKIDKNELFRTYCKLKDENSPLADSYLAAIVYKFWYMLTTNFYNQMVKIAPEEDAYNWLIDSVLYVAKHRPWEKEDNMLYNDPKGPEKAMSVKINSLKTNYFVALTRDKRSANKFVYTLDDQIDNGEYEDEGNDFVIHAKDISLYVVTDIIHECWKSLDYLTSFILDSIVNIDGCQEDQNVLLKHLRQLDDSYLLGFANTYDYPIEQVKQAKGYILDPRYHKPDAFKREVVEKIYKLSKNPKILSITEDYRKGE